MWPRGGHIFFMQQKQPLTYEKQLDLIKKRGCVVEDDVFALQLLKDINYYRLSAYFLQFKTKNDTYLSGTNLELVYNHYEFDREIRNILHSALEEIEINARAYIAYNCVHSYGPLGYLNSNNFAKNFDHAKFLTNLNDLINKNKNLPFVAHHIKNYNGNLPLWAATELFSFGMISKFYSGLTRKDQKIIADNHYNSLLPKRISSYLRCCTDARNICAHFGRFYNRKLSAIPSIEGLEEYQKRSLWAIILTTKILIQSDTKWSQLVFVPLNNIMNKYSKYIELKRIGFPSDWQNVLSLDNKTYISQIINLKKQINKLI